MQEEASEVYSNKTFILLYLFFKSWCGMKHETHNKPGKDAVLDYMVK